MAFAAVAGAHKQTGTYAADSFTSDTFDSSGVNFFYLVAHSYGAGGSITVSDSKSNSWSALTEFINPGNDRIRVYWSLPTSVGANHTVTVAGTGIYSFGSVRGFSGGSAATFDTGKEVGGDGQAASYKPGALTASGNDPLHVTALVWQTNSMTPAIDSGFATPDTNDFSSGNHVGGSASYKILSGAPSAQDPEWTNLGGVGGVHVVFLPGGGGGGGGGTSVGSKSLLGVGR